MSTITNTVKSFHLPLKYDSNGNQYFDEGAYSFVFFIGGIATKIFRRDKGLPEEHIRSVFNSEIEAYKRVQNSTDLIKITPKFLGAVLLEEISDNTSLSPKANILIPDCAYQMEYVPAQFVKLFTHPLYEEICERFAAAGIFYLKDASVATLTPPTEDESINLCVIDFATECRVPQW